MIDKDLISFILCFISYILYIVSTYFRPEEFFWQIYVDCIICTFLNIESIYDIYSTQNLIIHILQIDLLIDIFCSIPPYFGFYHTWAAKKIIEISHCLYIFKIARYINKSILMQENYFESKVYYMICSIISCVFFFASIFRVAEIDYINAQIMDPNTRDFDKTGQRSFHDLLYFFMITLLTVGYGDIYPLTELGRVIVMIFSVFALYMIPKLTTDFMMMILNTPIYSRDYYSANIDIPHIVIVGEIGTEPLKNYCLELFHEDHGQREKIVVILNQSLPSEDMKLFLHSGKYEKNLKYLQGNTFEENDFQRAELLESSACAIMTEKYSSNPSETDNTNIFLASKIKNIFTKNKVRDSPLTIQLIKPENKIVYQNLIMKSGIGTNDQIVIVEEIKMNLLSKSCLIPGIIPLVSNLIRSSGSSNPTSIQWLNEYLDGAGHEIYRAKLNKSFANHTFSQISKQIYQSFDALAFAMEIEVAGTTVISLNPGKFYVEKKAFRDKTVTFYLYLICSNKEVADVIENGGKKKEEDDRMDKDDDVESEESFLTNELLQKLEDNSRASIKQTEEEDEYFIIKDFVNNNVDVKKDSIRNSAIYRNHIVVCGTHSSLYYYILPLRARYLGQDNLKYIVILTKDMPKDLWDSISRFENIILINGSPSCIEDLLRANIQYADKVVILETENAKKIGYSKEEVDVEPILIYKMIKLWNPKVQVILEIVFDKNIVHLLDQNEKQSLKTREISYESTSAFSAGEVYISSIIDKLTCQAFYNQQIVSIIHQILAGSKNSSNSVLRLACENLGFKSGKLFQMDVPEKFIHKEFIELYKDFCNNNLIVLGLYRLRGARDNQKPYVYTKPAPETKLTHKDKIFVLGNDPLNPFTKVEENKRWKEKLKEKKEAEEKEEEEKEEDDIEREVNNEDNATPWNYLESQVIRMENLVEHLEETVTNARARYGEAIGDGIRQEIMSLLTLLK